MQKFYRDKSKIFECNLSIEGAALNETKARLILEFPNDRNLLFHGKIDSNGKCEILIPALKEMIESEGNVILEVIAESTHFESWRDKFSLETNKKVQVEMITPKKEIIENKITTRVEIISNDSQKTNNISEKMTMFKKYVNENKIDIAFVLKNKTNFIKLLKEYKDNNNLLKEDVVSLVNEIKELKQKDLIQKILL
jgi:hypothetical protein